MGEGQQQPLQAPNLPTRCGEEDTTLLEHFIQQFMVLRGDSMTARMQNLSRTTAIRQASVSLQHEDQLRVPLKTL